MKSKIIFLNGCGSAGKTSLAYAIQNISSTPWLRVGVDLLVDMLPSKYIALGSHAKEGYFVFMPDDNEHGQTMKIHPGPLGKNFFKEGRKLFGYLADHNSHLIIDEVLLEEEELQDYLEILKNHQVYFIGVMCDLKEMQKRERSRGDRSIGLSNDQIKRVHQGNYIYDLTVDTTYQSPEVVAKEILEFVEETKNPKAFEELQNYR